MLFYSLLLWALLITYLPYIQSLTNDKHVNTADQHMSMLYNRTDTQETGRILLSGRPVFHIIAERHSGLFFFKYLIEYISSRYTPNIDDYIHDDVYD